MFDSTWSWAGASLLLRSSSHLILIKRSLTMPTHAGQIAFFGGHKKENENHPFEVANREFEEESGVSSSFVELVGMLDPVRTSKNQPIVPVVGNLKLGVEDFLKTAKSNGEWDHLIALPWDEINKVEMWNWGWLKGKSEHKILTAPIAPGRYLQHLDHNQEGHVLWGATARMVWNYLSLYYRSQI
ncbi:MAG: NUDIX domain-containing protein [Bacteriovoracaceae bacterium]|nr:NUDIX domain-containing protein [Bacteriovoracaceae bacterium]